MRILLTSFIFLVSFSAIAEYGDGGIMLNWERPFGRSDSSPMTVSEIDHYKIWVQAPGTENEGYINTPELRTEGPETNYFFTPPDDVKGLWCFAVTTVDTQGKESKRSQIMCESYPGDLATPGKPNNLTVERIDPIIEPEPEPEPEQ